MYINELQTLNAATKKTLVLMLLEVIMSTSFMGSLFINLQWSSEAQLE
jgi:hypothetical protein